MIGRCNVPTIINGSSEDISDRYNYFDNEPLAVDITDNLTVAVTTSVTVSE